MFSNHEIVCLYLQIKDLSNVKEEVYGALDSFVAWELEFPLIAVKKALQTLEDEKEWKRIIQVLIECSYHVFLVKLLINISSLPKNKLHL
jgi:hypothetical protein